MNAFLANSASLDSISLQDCAMDPTTAVTNINHSMKQTMLMLIQGS